MVKKLKKSPIYIYSRVTTPLANNPLIFGRLYGRASCPFISITISKKGHSDSYTGWWQLKDFLFSPRNLGKMNDEDIFFRMGCKLKLNHQLAINVCKHAIPRPEADGQGLKRERSTKGAEPRGHRRSGSRAEVCSYRC